MKKYAISKHGTKIYKYLGTYIPKIFFIKNLLNKNPGNNRNAIVNLKTLTAPPGEAYDIDNNCQYRNSDYNPNCGKSTLFNHLTNLNQKTGNFSGVTVEKRSGTLNLNNKTIELIDLPGSFSLNGISEDKKALTRFLMKRESSDKILFIMDSALIERSMQFFLQIADLGAEIILVLTMRDILEKKNINLDIEKLKNELNIKIIYFNGKTKEGLEDLKELLVNPINFKALERKWEWDTKKENFIKKIILTLNSTNPIFSRFVLENSLKKESGEVLQKELPGIELFPSNVSEFILNEFKISNLSFTYQDELMSKSFYIKKLIANCIIKKTKVQNSVQSHLTCTVQWQLLPMIFEVRQQFDLESRLWP
jgi:ferrous iron transport protein B